MKSVLCPALLLLLTVSAGCGWSGGDDVSPLAAVSMPAPDSWSFSGTTWTRISAPSDDDWKVLKTFFDGQPGYTDSADLTGEPLVYRSAGSGHMFIWIHPAVTGSRWQLIRRQHGRFFQDSGTDLPWLEEVPQTP